MKLPENSAATFVKIAIALVVFAAGYYYPLFRPASSVTRPITPAASAADTAASVVR